MQFSVSEIAWSRDMSVAVVLEPAFRQRDYFRIVVLWLLIMGAKPPALDAAASSSSAA